MRYIIIVRAAAQRASGPGAALMVALADFHRALAAAGVLLDGSGLEPGRSGWRVVFRQGTGSVADGPAADDAEQIAGYTLLQAPSREAALEWSRRFPAPRDLEGCTIEVRPLQAPVLAGARA